MTHDLVPINAAIVSVPDRLIAGLSSGLKRKLATAVAPLAGKSDITEVTVGDLFNYFPTRYEDRSNLLPIDRLEEGLEAAVELIVKVSGGFRVGKNRNPRQPPLFLFELSGTDVNRSQRPVLVKWFVSGKAAERIVEYYQRRFAQGVRLVAYGRWELDGRRNTFALMVNKPEELEILPDGVASSSSMFDSTSSRVAAPAEENLDEDNASAEFATVHTARRVPVYRKLGPFFTKRLREIIYSLLENLDDASVIDLMPDDLLARQGLISKARATRELHFPPEDSTIADYEMFRSPAQTRFIFEEFFELSFAMQLLRGERTKETKGTVIEITPSTQKRILDLLPFELTGAQKRVTREILEDLTSDAPMNRLIQGDVGSGKTIVAFLSAFTAMENGYQAALMAPTEILAEQHFRNAVKIFADTGHRPGLLIGSLKTVDKRRVHAELANGDIDFVIGTHAIIQDAVKFSRLGLAIVDEQHRFGVLQRAQLRAAGYNPDILVMTATPIPRSLAMTVYGDLDVSTIDELPPGRTPIKTVVVGEDKREGVYRGIEREISQGRQVYVVYPLIDESEKLDLKAATKMYDDMCVRVFPNRSVGLLHGRMKSAEKDAIMQQFVAGKIDILVSTTVIEVGVDVPNATLMVIEHAERFGLSQLHQLRGRVGRGSDQSFCVLLTDFKKTAVAKERLGIMEASSDGFVIAEKDLEIRGQGEILGTRQSGVQGFRLGNIARDLEILIAARKEAEDLLTKRRFSPETEAFTRLVRSDKRVRLGGIG